jgi:hypothetical protein
MNSAHVLSDISHGEVDFVLPVIGGMALLGAFGFFLYRTYNTTGRSTDFFFLFCFMSRFYECSGLYSGTASTGELPGGSTHSPIQPRAPATASAQDQIELGQARTTTGTLRPFSLPRPGGRGPIPTATALRAAGQSQVGQHPPEDDRSGLLYNAH